MRPEDTRAEKRQGLLRFPLRRRRKQRLPVEVDERDPYGSTTSTGWATNSEPPTEAARANRFDRPRLSSVSRAAVNRPVRAVATAHQR